jgi:hypothetical protein
MIWPHYLQSLATPDINFLGEGVRIGKTPKKLDSICCPQRRETKADTLKAIGEGDQELEKRLVGEELT